MSAILGYDVNGRPLRAGDQCIYVNLVHFARDNGKIVRIVGSAGRFGAVETDEAPGPLFGGNWKVFTQCLRRLDDRTDHQPSEYTFDSLMDHLKSGVPA